jgi:hypothetical protein
VETVKCSAARSDLSSSSVPMPPDIAIALQTKHGRTAAAKTCTEEPNLRVTVAEQHGLVVGHGVGAHGSEGAVQLGIPGIKMELMLNRKGTAGIWIQTNIG